MRYLLFLLIVLFGFLEAKANDGTLNEAFDKSLGRLNSIALLNEYIDSCAVVQKVPDQSEAEVFLVNDIIERKFYHGYSHYTEKDNFLAYLAGKYVWDHLSAIVLPEDLVKHEMAACSQQAIVMMEILKRRGYKVRKLGLTGHYVLEVFYNKQWHIFDPNHEPTFQGVPHDFLSTYLDIGLISSSYSRTLSPERVKEVFTNMEIGKENSVPAKNARVFHLVTKFISQNIFLIIPAFIIGVFYFLKTRKQKKHRQTLRMQGRRVLSQDSASLSRKHPLAN